MTPILKRMFESCMPWGGLDNGIRVYVNGVTIDIGCIRKAFGGFVSFYLKLQLHPLYRDLMRLNKKMCLQLFWHWSKHMQQRFVVQHCPGHRGAVTLWFHQVVDTPEGQDAIWRELDRIKNWAHGNLVRFNKTKCKLLHLDQGTSQYQYRLGMNRSRVALPEGLGGAGGWQAGHRQP